MSVFHAGLQPALDSNGDPISGATWNFYATGTLTPVAVYSNAGLSTSLGTSVTANSAGRFAVVFLDDGTSYRAVLKDASGSTIEDIDPYNPDSSSGGTLNLKWFGALGDGVDDTDAIAAAVAAGGNIYLPDGTYRITTSGANFPINNTVRFYGGRGAILEIGGTAGALISANGCVFDGIELRRGDLSTVEKLFQFADDVDGCTFENCLIDGNMTGQISEDPYYGEFYASSTTGHEPKHLRWRKCEFTDTGNRAIDCRGVQDCIVDDCDFNDCGLNVPTGNPGTCVEFTANEAGGGAAVGISRRIQVVNNRFNRFGDGAINNRGVEGQVISGNVINGHIVSGVSPIGPEENGIAILGGTGIIANNTIRYVMASGIKIQCVGNTVGNLSHLYWHDVVVSGNTLIGGDNPFTAAPLSLPSIAETSFQLQNLDTTVTPTTISITGNTFSHSSAGMAYASITCNATTGMKAVSIVGNTFYGPGTADGSKALVLPSTGLSNLLGLMISANDFYNFQYAIYQAAGSFPSDAIIGLNSIGNVGTYTNAVGAALILQPTSFAFGTAPATTGRLRLSNADAIVARNGANNGNLTLLSTDSSNNIIVGTYLNIAPGTAAITFSSSSLFILGNSSVQSISAGGTITAAPVARVVGNGGAVTAATAAIAAGTAGQKIHVLGTSNTNTVTIGRSSTMLLAAATRVLGSGDVLTLLYSSSASAWCEVSFADNS